MNETMVEKMVSTEFVDPNRLREELTAITAWLAFPPPQGNYTKTSR